MVVVMGGVTLILGGSLSFPLLPSVHTFEPSFSSLRRAEKLMLRGGGVCLLRAAGFERTLGFQVGPPPEWETNVRYSSA